MFSFSPPKLPHSSGGIAQSFTCKPLSIPMSCVSRSLSQLYFIFVLSEKNDPELFRTFRQRESSVRMMFAFCLVAAAFIIYRCAGFVVNYPSVMSTSVVTISIFTVFSGTVLLWILYFVQFQKRKENTNYSPLTRYIYASETYWLVCVNISMGLLVITLCYNGTCENENSPTGCNRSLPHQMPENMMFALLFLPFIVSLIVKGVDFRYVFWTWWLDVGITIFCLIYYDLHISWLTFLIAAPLSFIVMCENQRQMLSMFYVTQSLQDLFKENARIAAENHTTEMRHMIGNVAHDLKTVRNCLLSCFLDDFV